MGLIHYRHVRYGYGESMRKSTVDACEVAIACSKERIARIQRGEQPPAPQHKGPRFFLNSFTLGHRKQLMQSEYVVWNLETTGLTHAARPVSVGAGAKIGPDTTFAQYKREYGSGLDCRVRVRISTVLLSDGTCLSWDLDKLQPGERADLIWCTVHEKNIIGHGLTFDLTWAMHLCGPELQPKFVLDTLLTTRCHKPAMTWDVHRMAAMGDENALGVVQEGDSKNASASLAALAAGHSLGGLDKSYQHPRNWCVTVLSEGHYNYVLGDVETPLLLACKTFGVQPATRFNLGFWNHLLKRLMDHDHDHGLAGSVYTRIYEKVPTTLARMSNRGIPVHEETLERVEAHRASLIPGLVDALIEQIPGMEAHRTRLISSQAGVPAEIKHVLADYAASKGFELGVGADGNPIIQAKKVKIKGASELPGWKAWDELQHTKKILGLCSEYRGISLPSKGFPGWRTLHPTIASRTVTLRAATETPNVQNLPRPQADLEDDLQFRSIVRGYEAPGQKWVIVSADYGQIELRIAAALALRCLKTARDVLQKRLHVTEVIPRWVIEALERGANPRIELQPDLPGPKGYSEALAIAYRNVLRSGALMAEAFRAGVDPHLLTGLGMAVDQGIVDIGGQKPLDYLKALSKDEQSALKKQIAAQRQSAKALNFGLLYGMQAEGLHVLGITDYGLAWSLDDAKNARAGWFSMYPEILFWQLWLKYVALKPRKDAEFLLVRDRYSYEIKRAEVRLGVSRTLAGRPVCAELPREIGNYSDQGSGADMMLEAITSLPAPYCDYVMNTIHDEVLMLVPEHLAQEASAVLQKAMLDAANRVLGPYGIPAEADPMVSDFWTKD